MRGLAPRIATRFAFSIGVSRIVLKEEKPPPRGGFFVKQEPSGEAERVAEPSAGIPSMPLAVYRRTSTIVQLQGNVPRINGG
jgi:hypothetical protein